METSNIPGIGQVDIYDYIPSNEEKKLIEDFQAQAEKDIEELKQTGNIHLRWSEFEIKRAKKIAKKLGMPYQTYLKSVLKQAMDVDEKRLSI